MGQPALRLLSLANSNMLHPSQVGLHEAVELSKEDPAEVVVRRAAAGRSAVGERRVHRLLHLRPESLQRLEAARRQLEAQVGASGEIVVS